MKHQGTVALLLFLSVVGSGAATLGTARSARTLRSGDASLDLSENRATERKLLLGRLSQAEGLTSIERQALGAQQRVLVSLAQDQEVLENRVDEMEAIERAAASGGVIQEQGTMTNSAGRILFERQQTQPVQEQVYKVAMDKNERAKATNAKTSTANEIVILLRGPERDFWNDYNKAFWEKMVGICLYLIQIFIMAFLYMQFCKQSAIPKLPESQVRTEEFQFGAFDASECARDCQMGICAACCPWIRWAETASKEHISFLAFIPGLFITALLASAGAVTFGASIPILLLIVVLCRQRIRDAYGLPSGTCGILFGDCLLWICCPCCAIIQEARQVEYVEAPAEEYNTLRGSP